MKTPRTALPPPLIEGMFHPLDWGGANETFPLPGGRIGVGSDHSKTTSTGMPGLSTSLAFVTRRRTS